MWLTGMDRFLLRYDARMKRAVTRVWWCWFQQGNIGLHLVSCSNSEENMTNTSSGSNSTWGAFTPVMPAFIRLIAGVIVLVIIEAALLRSSRGKPEISCNNHLLSHTFSVLSGLVARFS